MISSTISDWLGWLWSETDGGYPVLEWAARMMIILAFVGLVMGVVSDVRAKDGVSGTGAGLSVGAALGLIGPIVLPAVIGWPVVALFWAVGL